MTQPITLADIRTAAETLGNAATRAAAVASELEKKIAEAVTPIYTEYRAAIDATAEEQADAHRHLMSLLQAAPDLFSGTPRSITVAGVKAGYRRGEDTLDWDDDDVVIKRIRALAAEHADVCIRTAESLVVDALAQLPQAKLSQLGVRRLPGIDNPFITIGLTEVDQLVKTILAAAQQRQGEDDKPKAAKGKGKAAKPKAKAKEPA